MSPLPSAGDDRDRPDAVLRYDGHDAGGPSEPWAVIDVHLPGAGLARDRVLVLLHGGFWRTAHDRRHTRPLARSLADAGWVVATPEYRRVGEGDGSGGGWPTTAQDVRRAVRSLPRLLPAIGVDVGPLTLTGHSAGGHLALWLADEPDLEIERVVALAPVGDLREAARLDLGCGATQEFMGGAPDEVDYGPADPMTRLSPHPTATVAVVHGDADDRVPLSLSEGLVAAHPWIDLHVVPGDHFAVIDPADPAHATVLRALAGR